MDYLSSQRAIIARDGALLGQGSLLGDRFITALHVLDPILLATDAGLVLAGPNGHSQPLASYAVERAIPQSDALILKRSLADGGPRARLTFEERCACGDRVVIPAVRVGRDGTLFGQLLTSRVHEEAEVEVYSYAAASGQIIRLTRLRVIFLQDTLPRGVSGAPIYVEGTGRALGLVHGNAPHHDNRGVCLDARPIAESLAAEFDQHRRAWKR
jgi:hypothetical protein